MRKFDFSMLIGIFVAISFIVASIYSEGNFKNYLNLPSFFIVIGCTISVSCASFSFKDVITTFKALASLIIIPLSPKKIAVHCLKTTEVIKEAGVLNYEKHPNFPKKINKIFLKWLSYVADGYNIQTIENLTNQEIYSWHEQQITVVQLLKKAAEMAPAYGLIGTLIGLIDMLSNLEDVSKIGAGMSVALLTTFYGAIFAYIFLLPIANKIEKNIKENVLNYRIFQETVISIYRKDNPRHLESILNSILPPDKKVVYYKYDEEDRKNKPTPKAKK